MVNLHCLTFHFGTMKQFLKQIYQQLPFKQNAFHLLKRYWLPPKWIYRYLLFEGVFQVKIDEQHRFWMQHYGFGFWIENELFWRGFQGSWEPKSLAIWVKLCQEAQTIVDIGANTGVYALTAKAICPKAKVIAIEPLDRTYRKLVQNNLRNDFDICCLAKAVSNFTGQANLIDEGYPNFYGAALQNNGAKTEHTQVVEVITLAQLIRNHQLDQIDLIKIDVEQQEAKVLEGMGDYLAQMKPTLLIEILTNELGQAIETLTLPLGYTYFYINEAEGLQAVKNLKRRKWLNYLLVSRELRVKSYEL